MIIDHRTYTLFPGKAPEYLELYENEGIEIQVPILGNLVGYFHSEIGPLNQIIHMWGYDSLDERARRRAELTADERWKAYLAKARTLIVQQENKILVPAPFSPIR